MRFDLFLYGSIDICGSSIYMYAVRFLFVRFYLFFAVLMFNERVSLFCARLILYERVLKILSLTERHTTRSGSKRYGSAIMVELNDVTAASPGC